MRLILNKALDTINDSVNIKIIEITSADFLNNDLDYFVYKYQIPLIKFTDTEEIFNIKNFKSELSSSLSETEIILDENDLELISSGGGGGSSPTLQSVLNVGNNSVDRPVGMFASGSGFANHTTFGYDGVVIYSDDIGNGSSGVIAYTKNNISSGTNNSQKRNTLNITRQTVGNAQYSFPEKITGNYILATIEDIYKIPNLPIFADNSAAITGGLAVNSVYKTATGELRIVV